jgi:proteasome lid subunit RPN8/RPN11
VKVFEVEIDSAILRAIIEHGEAAFPNEACGVALGRPDIADLEILIPMKNVQDRYHALDPIQFPRTSRDAFRIDELERMRMLEKHAGLVERILYHSHCDAGAYFSPEDRAMAVHGGVELMPGIVHVVVSVRDGRAQDMAAFTFDAPASSFVEQRIPLTTDAGLPDLEARRMEGREAARPIKPVGRGLCLRRLTKREAELLPPLAEGRRIRLSEDDQAKDIACLEAGLFSPLTGFLRSADVFSIDFKGRLQSGTPWRTPLRLELPKRSVPTVPGGAVVELETVEGRPIALMAVVSLEVVKETVFLGGPVYVYPRYAAVDAAESRAELVRAQAAKVLAIPPGTPVGGLDLAPYDAILCAGEIAGRRTLPLVPSHRGPWLQAVIAQNQGATHIVTADPSLAHHIRETLEIEPVVP